MNVLFFFTALVVLRGQCFIEGEFQRKMMRRKRPLYLKCVVLEARTQNMRWPSVVSGICYLWGFCPSLSPTSLYKYVKTGFRVRAVDLINITSILFVGLFFPQFLSFTSATIDDKGVSCFQLWYHLRVRLPQCLTCIVLQETLLWRLEMSLYVGGDYSSSVLAGSAVASRGETTQALPFWMALPEACRAGSDKANNRQVIPTMR